MIVRRLRTSCRGLTACCRLTRHRWPWPSEPMRWMCVSFETTDGMTGELNGRAKFHLSRSGLRLGRSTRPPVPVCGSAGALALPFRFAARQEHSPSRSGLRLGRSTRPPVQVRGSAGALALPFRFAARQEHSPSRSGLRLGRSTRAPVPVCGSAGALAIPLIRQDNSSRIRSTLASWAFRPASVS